MELPTPSRTKTTCYCQPTATHIKWPTTLTRPKGHTPKDTAMPNCKNDTCYIVMPMPSWNNGELENAHLSKGTKAPPVKRQPRTYKNPHPHQTPRLRWQSWSLESSWYPQAQKILMLLVWQTPPLTKSHLTNPIVTQQCKHSKGKTANRFMPLSLEEYNMDLEPKTPTASSNTNPASSDSFRDLTPTPTHPQYSSTPITLMHSTTATQPRQDMMEEPPATQHSQTMVDLEGEKTPTPPTNLPETTTQTEQPKPVTILFLDSTLFLISSFCATSPFPGSLCYTYHHYLLILGPLTFTVRAL